MTPLVIAIPLFILIALAAAGATYYAIVLIRLENARRTLPTLRDGLKLADQRASSLDGGCRDTPPGACPARTAWPSVTLVVPAHNEQDVIEAHVRSVTSQQYPGGFRAVFALDRCTDRTESIVRAVIAELPADQQDRFEIVIVRECPPDWAGKVHAIHRGVKDSRNAQHADRLLFADADTIFDPSCIRAAVALMDDRNVDMLSLLSTLTRDHWFEFIVQPAAGFELVRQFPLDVVNRADKPRPFANGQFMLWKRTAYDSLGGHELVKNELLEDIALARWMMWKKTGLKWGVFMAAGLLTCRMYRTWDAFQRGWMRIYTEAAQRRPARLIQSARRLLLTGVALSCAGPIAFLAGIVTLILGDKPLGAWLLATGLVATALTWLALGRAYRAQRVPPLWIAAYPLGAFITSRLLHRAGRDLNQGRATQWAGREYAREARP